MVKARKKVYTMIQNGKQYVLVIKRKDHPEILGICDTMKDVQAHIQQLKLWCRIKDEEEIIVDAYEVFSYQ